MGVENSLKISHAVCTWVSHMFLDERARIFIVTKSHEVEDDARKSPGRCIESRTDE